VLLVKFREITKQERIKHYMSNTQSQISDWPENPNGEPLKRISTSVEEQIPTVRISNSFSLVIILYASVTEFVDDPEEGIRKNQEILEAGLAKKREEILDELEKEKED
jgi:hypothetical protein